MAIDSYLVGLRTATTTALKDFCLSNSTCGSSKNDGTLTTNTAVRGRIQSRLILAVLMSRIAAAL